MPQASSTLSPECASWSRVLSQGRAPKPKTLNSTTETVAWGTKRPVRMQPTLVADPWDLTQLSGGHKPTAVLDQKNCACFELGLTRHVWACASPNGLERAVAYASLCASSGLGYALRLTTSPLPVCLGGAWSSAQIGFRGP